MKTNLLMMAVAAGIAGLSGAASAEIVTVTYSGSVIEITPGDGIPPASEGESLVATYVFNLPNATDTMIDPMTGGFAFGPYGSFATASLTVGGVAAPLPAFATGQINGANHVSDTGSVLDAEVTGVDPATQLISLVDGLDFSWNLAAPTDISFSPSGDDEAMCLSGILSFPMFRHIQFMTIVTSRAAPATLRLIFSAMGNVRRYRDDRGQFRRRGGCGGQRAGAQFAGSRLAAYSESAGGSAYADPTFAIDDPAFANYTIVGVPVGSRRGGCAGARDLGEMLPGFAGLGYARYRKAKGSALLAA